MNSPVKIAGAGLKGLSIAWYLKDRFPVEIYEKTNRAGGWIRSYTDGDFFFEAGPRGFRPKGLGLLTLELIKELGLEGELLAPSPQSSIRYLYVNKKLTPLPYNFRTFFSPFLIPLIKAGIKDLVYPPSSCEGTVEAYFTNRIGQEATQLFVDPMVSGIYAGDISKLSMKACFPRVKPESLIRQALFKKKSTQDNKWSKYPLLTLKGGMETLTAKLASNFKIHYENPLDSSCLNAAPQKGIDFASLAVVNVGYKRGISHYKGFGYLVPSIEKESILGCIFDSETFPEQNKTTGELRLTVMAGGVKNPAVVNDPNLPEIVLEALSRHLGIKAAPSFLNVTKCINAIPQYPVGFKSNGNGINDTVHLAKESADEYLFSRGYC